MSLEIPDDPALEVDILAGNRIEIGLADILTAGKVWADLIEKVADGSLSDQKG